MDRKEELSLFLEKADDLINCKYILADTKIVALLKAIASSQTILAVLQCSLNDFDFNTAMDKYLIRSQDSAHGEYVMPSSSGDIIALGFSVFMAIDSGEIDFGVLLKEYFYADGSVFGSYALFIDQVVKPFKNTVKTIVEGVISGKVKDPKETIKEMRESQVVLKKLPKEETLSQKETTLALRLLNDAKTAVLTSGIDAEIQADAFMIIDGLLTAIEEVDKQAIKQLFVAYKYFAIANKKINLKVQELFTALKEGRAL